MDRTGKGPDSSDPHCQVLGFMLKSMLKYNSARWLFASQTINGIPKRLVRHVGLRSSGNHFTPKLPLLSRSKVKVKGAAVKMLLYIETININQAQYQPLSYPESIQTIQWQLKSCVNEGIFKKKAECFFKIPSDSQYQCLSYKAKRSYQSEILLSQPTTKRVCLTHSS